MRMPKTIEEAQARLKASNQPAASPVAGAPQGRPRKPVGRGKADARRWATLNAFVDVTAARLSRSELAVWLVLFRDVRDGVARTGLTDIARRGGMDHGSAKRAVRSLVAKGLVTIVRRGRRHGGPSIYRVTPTIFNGAQAPP